MTLASWSSTTKDLSRGAAASNVTMRIRWSSMMRGVTESMIWQLLQCSKWSLPPILLVLVLACATTAPEVEGTRSVGDDVVCRVDGKEIHRSDVEVKKRKLLPGANFHGGVDPARQQEMRRSALQSLIIEELEYRDALRREVSVDDEKVAREYTRLASRYGGREAFEERIEGSGIKVEKVKAALEREFLIARVKELVAEPKQEISEEDKRRYFAENSASFEMPRQAQVRQILIFMPPLERDPDDWQRAFERANALRDRVQAGESFSDLAVEASHASGAEKANGGLLGLIHPGRLQKNLDDAIWSLQPGEVSEPIREFKGVYLLMVDHFVEPRQMAYEELEQHLGRLLLKKQRQQTLDDWQASLRERAEIEIVDPALDPAVRREPEEPQQPVAEPPPMPDARIELDRSSSAEV